MIYVNKIETEELGLHYTAFESEGTVHIFDGVVLQSMEELEALASGDIPVYLGEVQILPPAPTVDNAAVAFSMLLTDYTLSTNYPPRIRAIEEAVQELGNDAPAQLIYLNAKSKL